MEYELTGDTFALKGMSKGYILQCGMKQNVLTARAQAEHDGTVTGEGCADDVRLPLHHPTLRETRCDSDVSLK